MYEKGIFAVKAAALAAALLVLSGSPPAAVAEGGRGGGGGGGGGSHGGSGGGGSYHGGGSGYHGGGGDYHGGYGGYRSGNGYYFRGGADYYHGGRYYGGGYYPGIGIGIGLYATPYVYDYSPTYVYGGAPSVVVASPGVNAADATDGTAAPQPPPEPTDDRARVQVLVPADAEVWFNGNATTQRGEQRVFASPPLTPGHEYQYEIRARWKEDGRVVDHTRTIVVRPNARIGVDFGEPEPVAAPVPK